MATLYGVTWSFLIDWDDDGDFNEPYEDVTEYVIGAEWTLGMGEAFQLVADESSATIELNNSDRRFSPENGSSPYFGEILPLRKVQVKANFNSVDYVMYTGWINNINVETTRSRPQVALECVGVKNFLEDDTVFLPFRQNVTADEVIYEVVAKSIVPPVYQSGTAWLLGKENYSKIGNTTYIADPDTAFELDTGLHVIPFVGDAWDKESVKVMTVINDLMASERGRFIVDQEGKIVFWNRQHIIANTEPSDDLNNEHTESTYVYGNNIVNDVRIKVYPRKVSDNDDDLLWSLNEPVTIEADGSQSFEANFTREDSSDKISALSVRLGDIVSTLPLGVSIQAEASRASITVTNLYKEPVTLSTLTLIGQKITTFDVVEIIHEDEKSIATYGRRERSIDAKTLSSTSLGDTIARFELSRFKDPFGTLQDITLGTRNDTWTERMLSLTFGDRVTISEYQSMDDSDYFIIGMTHRLTSGTGEYTTTFVLEPAINQVYWVIGVTGYSEIGETTRTSI